MPPHAYLVGGVQLFTHLWSLNFVTRIAIVAHRCVSYAKARLIDSNSLLDIWCLLPSFRQNQIYTFILCDLYFLFQFFIQVRVPYRAGMIKLWLDNGIAQHSAQCWCQKFIFTVKKFQLPIYFIQRPQVPHTKFHPKHNQDM